MAVAALRSGAGLYYLVALAAWLASVRCFAASLRTDPKTKRLKLQSPKYNENYRLKCLNNVSAHNAQDSLTAVLSVSPRPEDATGDGFEDLKIIVQNIREQMGINRAHLVVAFEALPTENSTLGTHALSTSAAWFYRKKYRDFKAWNALQNTNFASVYQNREPTAKTEMLHRVFDDLKGKNKMTPLFYMADDNEIVRGKIALPFILRQLSCDPDVDYVSFHYFSECNDEYQQSSDPCEPHPRTEQLFSVGTMGDRPHFATAQFYYDQVFGRTPQGPAGREPIQLQRAWVYGDEHEMNHALKLYPMRPKEV